MAEYDTSVRILEALGAVPKGAPPKTILAGDENQEPGYYQTDPLSNLVRTLKSRQLQIDDALKKKQEAVAKKADMYKTLREAGYDPKSAYEAVIKGNFPTEEGGVSLKEQQDKANLEKTKLTTEKTKLDIEKIKKDLSGSKPAISQAQAVNILANPINSEHLRTQYPDLYKKVEDISKGILGEEIGKFTPDQENLIQDNMDHFEKSREEVIAALKKRGLL